MLAHSVACVAQQVRQAHPVTVGATPAPCIAPQAHLAGMILGIVERNTRPAFQVLCVARFARLNTVRQDTACNLLARLIGADMPPTVGLVHVARLMRGCTGRAINVADLAEQAGVTRMTANRWRIIVQRFVREIEAASEVEIALRLRGLAVITNQHVSL